MPREFAQAMDGRTSLPRAVPASNQQMPSIYCHIAPLTHNPPTQCLQAHRCTNDCHASLRRVGVPRQKTREVKTIIAARGLGRRVHGVPYISGTRSIFQSISLLTRFRQGRWGIFPFFFETVFPCSVLQELGRWERKDEAMPLNIVL